MGNDMEVLTISDNAPDPSTSADDHELVSDLTSEILEVIVFVVGLVIYWGYVWYRQRRNGQGEQHVHPDLADGVADYRTTMVNQEEYKRRVAESRLRDNDVCSICLGTPSFPVLTNCGHVFCCLCLYGYWTYTGILSRVKCAICRTPVSVMLPFAWPNEHEDNVEDAAESNKKLNEYNGRFSKDTKWYHHLRDLPVLIPYIVRSVFDGNALVVMFRLRIVFILCGILCYVLLPYDLIPEFANGFIGLVDDIFVAALMLVYLSIAIRQYLAHRQV